MAHTRTRDPQTNGVKALSLRIHSLIFCFFVLSAIVAMLNHHRTQVTLLPSNAVCFIDLDNLKT